MGGASRREKKEPRKYTFRRYLKEVALESNNSGSNLIGHRACFHTCEVTAKEKVVVGGAVNP